MLATTYHLTMLYYVIHWHGGGREQAMNKGVAKINEKMGGGSLFLTLCSPVFLYGGRFSAELGRKRFRKLCDVIGGVLGHHSSTSSISWYTFGITSAEYSRNSGNVSLARNSEFQ